MCEDCGNTLDPDEIRAIEAHYREAHIREADRWLAAEAEHGASAPYPPTGPPSPFDAYDVEPEHELADDDPYVQMREGRNNVERGRY